MLSDRELITHNFDHVLTMIEVLCRADPANETLKQIHDAMDAAYLELTRRRGGSAFA
jgi:hypothetical protein